MSDSVLSIRNLSVRYSSRESSVQAVSDVSLELKRGEIRALVGESGSGKTTIGLSVLRLLPTGGKITAGQIIFRDHDLVSLPDKRLREVRGQAISMIFQDPVSGLNPVITVGQQVEEMLRGHLGLKKGAARERTIELFHALGLPDPEQQMKRYPFQLSGGMCQCVMIAIATALNPEIIIADEPTSALDVTVQAGILRELELLRERQGTTILLITHDFGVVAQIADLVTVLYAGSVVEEGTVSEVLRRPRHPYTHALLNTLPRLDSVRGSLPAIKGNPPGLAEQPEHCSFLPRCNKATLDCRQGPFPPLRPTGDNGHLVACYNPVFHLGDD